MWLYNYVEARKVVLHFLLGEFASCMFVLNGNQFELQSSLNCKSFSKANWIVSCLKYTCLTMTRCPLSIESRMSYSLRGGHLKGQPLDYGWSGIRLRGFYIFVVFWHLGMLFNLSPLKRRLFWPTLLEGEGE